MFYKYFDPKYKPLERVTVGATESIIEDDTIL